MKKFRNRIRTNGLYKVMKEMAKDIEDNRFLIDYPCGFYAVISGKLRVCDPMMFGMCLTVKTIDYSFDFDIWNGCVVDSAIKDLFDNIVINVTETNNDGEIFKHKFMANEKGIIQVEIV